MGGSLGRAVLSSGLILMVFEGGRCLVSLVFTDGASRLFYRASRVRQWFSPAQGCYAVDLTALSSSRVAGIDGMVSLSLRLHERSFKMGLPGLASSAMALSCQGFYAEDIGGPLELSSGLYR